MVIRDGKCRWCDVEGKKTYRDLEVHHIIPVAASPENVFNNNNAITLCRPHHLRTKGREDVFAEFLSDILKRQLVCNPIANNRKVSIVTSAAELTDLYWIKKLSSVDIAKIKGVTPECIQLYMRRLGVPRRTNKEASENFNGKRIRVAAAKHPKGRGQSGYSLSTEVKEKISEAVRLLWENPEYRLRMSKAAKKVWTVERRCAQADRVRGSRHTVEHRAKISAGLLNVWRGDDSKMRNRARASMKDVWRRRRAGLLPKPKK